jgi:hypothetical protein
MTVPADDSVDLYTGNGSTTAFVYRFKIDDASEIKASIAGVLKILNTHYTVSGVGNSAGGSVTFVTAPGDGLEVALRRNQVIEQGTNYIANASFNPLQVMRDLDDAIKIDQQQQEEINRSLTLLETIQLGVPKFGILTVALAARSVVITHNLGTASAFLVSAFTNWNNGGMWVSAQDANTITVEFANENSRNPGLLYWGVAQSGFTLIAGTGTVVIYEQDTDPTLNVPNTVSAGHRWNDTLNKIFYKRNAANTAWVSWSTVLLTDFTTPSAPQNGDFWIEASGISPNRIISLKIRDGGETFTLASVQH